MTSKTSIEWTDRTWNPIRGCSRISPGCVNCYAERIAARFSSPGGPFHLFANREKSGSAWTGTVELIEDQLQLPLGWRKPSRVFVNSMSDMFHENLKRKSIYKVFAVMSQSPDQTFQILTKRADIMRQVLSESCIEDLIDEAANDLGMCHANVQGRWPLPNVWLGVSAETQDYADKRIPELLATPAAKRFVSYEPALEAVDFYSYMPCAHEVGGCSCEFCREWDVAFGLDWLIIGGESGPGARPFDIAWAESAIEQCKAAGVPVFMKQFGADPREGNANGNCRNVECTHPDCGYVRLKLKDPKGGDPSEWPEWARVRQFPGEALRG